MIISGQSLFIGLPMRDMEFRELKPGDVICSANKPEDVWTVVAWQKKHDTFLIVQGRHDLNSKKLIWKIMPIVSDSNCLLLSDRFDLRVGRILDPKNWSKFAVF